MTDKSGGLPEDITILIRQMVINGRVRLAGVILHSYFRRFYKVDETIAAKWICIYFQREFSKEFSKHQSRTKTKQ